MRNNFTLFPAIDLRQGRVVRLKEGDPSRQTKYADDPASVAGEWLDAGANWLHVVNLDGAFGGSVKDNLAALTEILGAAEAFASKVQFGGGLRSVEDIRRAREMGVGRVMLGTLAVEQPDLLVDAIERHGAEAVGVAVDARDGIVRTRGWQHDSGLEAIAFGKSLAGIGLRWLAFTDIARDGMGSGLNLAATRAMAQATGLQVIASGGVRDRRDLYAAREAGLAGAIVGRALYEGNVNLREWFMK